MKRTNKLLALILSVSLLTPAVSALEYVPLEPQIHEVPPQASAADSLSEFLLNKIDQEPDEIAAIQESTSETENQPQRAPAQSNTDSPVSDTEPQESESTDNELTLQLTDGTYSFYSFSEAIKFTDENGVIRYKDTTIVSQTDDNLNTSGYTYTNGPNNFRINFAPAVDKGVFTEYDGLRIGFIPVPNSEDYAQTGNKSSFMLDGNSVDSFEYPDLYGEGSVLRYTAQLNALKQDIILPQYTGQNEFHFILDTYGNTAVLGEDGKTIQILDPETDEILRKLAPIYAYDSFGGYYSDDYHYTEDCYYTLSSREDGRYDLGVVVSEEYLSNPDLIYPVTIDPSDVPLTNLQDAPVYSAQSGTNWGSATTMCCGHSSVNGSGRSYIKFSTNSLPSEISVTNATLTLRETTGRTTDTRIIAYIATNAWTETGVNWNNKPGHRIWMSSHIINSENGYLYNFWVAPAVQEWVTGMPNYGLALVSADEENPANYWRAFATKEYSVSDFHPMLKINYEVNSAGASISSGIYYIRNKQSGLYLDAAGGLGAGTQLLQYNFHGAVNQQWQITSTGGGYYKISPAYNTNLVVEPHEGLALNNRDILLSSSSGTSAQRWKFISGSDGSYRIVSKLDNTKAIVVEYALNTSGADIICYDYSFGGNTNDDWFLEEAEWTPQSAIFNSGEVPTVWNVDLGDGSVLFAFVKRYSAQIGYQYNSKQITLNYIENYTSIQQTHPVSVVGTVSAVNARAVVNDEMLIMYGCLHDGHIVAPGAFACNSFYPSITNLIGNTTINTYGFVNVPGPPLVGSAVCIDNSYQCFITITL